MQKVFIKVSSTLTLLFSTFKLHRLITSRKLTVKAFQNIISISHNQFKKICNQLDPLFPRHPSSAYSPLMRMKVRNESLWKRTAGSSMPVWDSRGRRAWQLFDCQSAKQNFLQPGFQIGSYRVLGENLNFVFKMLSKAPYS